MEAEDVVQEAYLRFRASAPSGRSGSDELRSPRAYLATIVTRLCLDQLKSARARREQYIGPWLPEPLPTGAADPELQPGCSLEERDSLSMAMLVLLESLAPLERAVFVLREAFDYRFREIAELTGRREEACRQAFHRAQRSLERRRPRYHASAEELERLTTTFVQAATSGDVQQLTRLLAADVTCWTDGGGKASAATRPLHGPERVVRFTAGTMRKAPPDLSFAIEQVNHQPAVVVRNPDGTVFFLLLLDGDASGIHALYGFRNPDKLVRFVRASQQIRPRSETSGSAPRS
jgi:RNA polymerase sigma-70 factor (ECF subfamily)